MYSINFRSNSFKSTTNVGKLTVYVENKLHLKDFKTTYSIDICESNIQTYLDAHNIDRNNIIKSYFKGKQYKC